MTSEIFLGGNLAMRHFYRQIEKKLAEAAQNGRHIAAFISESMFVIPGVFTPPSAYFKCLYR
jgi:hypothetical protein